MNKEYLSPYDAILEVRPDVLDILTEDEKDVLRFCMDFDSLVLAIHDGIVDTVDVISEEVLQSETISDFLHNSIKYAMEEA